MEFNSSLQLSLPGLTTPGPPQLQNQAFCQKVTLTILTTNDKTCAVKFLRNVF